MGLAVLKDLTKGLRDWQIEAIQNWIDNSFRGIVEVVTGGGKTRFALAALQGWLANNTSESAVVVLVPTVSLQDQWFVNLVDDLGADPEDICVWPAEVRPDVKFHILVVNTARNRVAELSQLAPHILLIADECHRYASEENAKALDVRNSASLGLTATADREFDDGLERTLIPKLGRIIFKYGIEQASQDGVVSDFELFNVRVPLTASEQAEYQKASRALGLALAQEDHERAKAIALKRARVAKNAISRVSMAVVLADRLRNRRTVVFHEEVSMADLLLELLSKRGHRVAIYHSGISKDMRRDNLRLFRRGFVDMLVCCRALDEGIDIPEADSAILVASTSSTRQRVQRLGRVLRVHSSKQLATIYTVYASDHEEERLANEVGRLEGVASVKWLEMK